MLEPVTPKGTPVPSAWEEIQGLLKAPEKTPAEKEEAANDRLRRMLMTGGLEMMSGRGSLLEGLGRGGKAGLAAGAAFDKTRDDKAQKGFENRRDVAKVYADMKGAEAKLQQTAENKRLDRNQRDAAASELRDLRKQIAEMQSSDKGDSTEATREATKARIDAEAGKHMRSITEAAQNATFLGQPFDRDAAENEVIQLYPSSAAARNLQKKRADTAIAQINASGLPPTEKRKRVKMVQSRSKEWRAAQ